MTDYKFLKQSLQKIGFRTIDRKDGWTILSDGDYTISIQSMTEWVRYHAETCDGRPVSWYMFEAINGNYMLIGVGFKLVNKPIIDGSREFEIGKALYRANAAIEGHHFSK